MTKKKQNRPGITIQMIEDYLRRGYSYTQMADELGVSKQAISDCRRRYGHVYTLREEALKHFPWDLPNTAGPHMNDQWAYRNARNHAEFVFTNGEGMPEESIERLRWFYKKLRTENVVLEYDPNIPPHEGMAHGGFAYRPRIDEDGDLIIRDNRYTNITEDGRYIWTFPAREP